MSHRERPCLEAREHGAFPMQQMLGLENAALLVHNMIGGLGVGSRKPIENLI